MTVASLKEKQFEFFEREGYLMLPALFEPAEIEPLRLELHAAINECIRELHAAGELHETFEGESFESQLARMAEADLEGAKRVIALIEGKAGGGYCGQAMFDMICHPKLLSVMADLLGEEIIGSSIYRIRPKLPGYARGEVPWHQDQGYLLPHCDDQLIITCWLPLVDATVENGCLQVLPRAHRNGLFKHYTGGNAGYLVVPEDELPPVEPLHVPVPLGGVLLMTDKTPHCSAANTTPLIRWSIDLRYQSDKVPNNIGQAPEDFAPERPPYEIACYPPEADFVIRSTRHPEREVRTLQQFMDLRTRFEKAPPDTYAGIQFRPWPPIASKT